MDNPFIQLCQWHERFLEGDELYSLPQAVIQLLSVAGPSASCTTICMACAGNHEEESEFRYGDDYLDNFDCEDNWDVPAPITSDGSTQCAMSYR